MVSRAAEKRVIKRNVMRGISHLVSIAVWLSPRMAWACTSDTVSGWALGLVTGMWVGVLTSLVVASAVLLAMLHLLRRFVFPRMGRGMPLAILAVVLGLILGVLGILAVPQFALVFTSFSADLPALTTMLIEYRWLLWLPLLLVVLRWRWLCAHRLCVRAWLLASAVEVLLLSLVLVALYWPIFKLGAGCE